MTTMDTELATYAESEGWILMQKSMNETILRALRCLRCGNFSARLSTNDLEGIEREIAETFNEVAMMHQSLAHEIERVDVVVGKEGKIDQRANLPNAEGEWKRIIDNINNLISDMVRPTTEVVRVIEAVAKGDLSQTIALEWNDGTKLEGEFYRIGEVVNTMVDQLNSFASEVIRVAREVGTEGKLGGQAEVKGVAGIWKDLTDNVNTMAANLTCQVRAISEVATTVTKGDFTRSIIVEASGEVGTLKNIINEMIYNLKESTLKITLAKEAAESTSRAKSNFIENMSSQIRTPMCGILGMTELALATKLTTEQLDYLQMVQCSANTLLNVINNTVYFSKMETRKLYLQVIDFSFRATVHDTLKILALSAHQKKLELICDIKSDIPDKLIGDPERLRQILLNLLGNAIKFTQIGEVVLSVKMQNLTETTCTLHFSVSDTGIGIHKDKLSVIFKALSQVDGPITRKYGGCIGLPISSRLVDLMQGQLYAESVLDQGSTFHFTVCLLLAKPSSTIVFPLLSGTTLTVDHFSPSLETVPLPPSSLVNASVLIVDDNLSNRKALSNMLSDWKMEVHLADSGETAIAMLHAAVDEGRPYQLILLDTQMPVLDGFAVAERIKQDPWLSQGARVLMMTSAGQRSDSAQNAGLGISVYVTKPVSHGDLLNAFKEPKEVVVCPVPQKPQIKRAANILLVEDNIINQKIMIRLLGRLGHKVTVVENGLQAVNSYDVNIFDIILMDIQMPVMDGLEATAIIRDKEQQLLRHTPIIGLIANSDKEECLEAGMDDLISKPIRIEGLRILIEKYLHSNEHEDVSQSTSEKKEKKDPIMLTQEDKKKYEDIAYEEKKRCEKQIGASK